MPGNRMVGVTSVPGNRRNWARSERPEASAAMPSNKQQPGPAYTNQGRYGATICDAHDPPVIDRKCKWQAAQSRSLKIWPEVKHCLLLLLYRVPKTITSPPDNMGWTCIENTGNSLVLGFRMLNGEIRRCGRWGGTFLAMGGG